ncbi:MAG: MGMT family protein [Polyangiales bacterium]
MQVLGYALFDTAIGCCGIAWSSRGVVRAQLPEASAAATRARLAHLTHARETEPPAAIAEAIEAITELLQGAPNNLLGIELDLSEVPDFAQRVYAAARRIPVGKTITYGALARHIGNPGSARALGQALGNNPFAPIVPCHRIVAAHGGTGGFSADGGVYTKLKMLAIERGDPEPTLTPQRRDGLSRKGATRNAQLQLELPPLRSSDERDR